MASMKWMGGLVWSGYLSHTQVVESSNLSPSNSIYRASFSNVHVCTVIFSDLYSQLINNIENATEPEIARNILVRFIDLSSAFE